MTTIAACPPYRTATKIPVIIIIALILVAACLYGTHAVEKHGDDALAVRDCIERGGGIELWTNPDTGRQAEVCLLPSGKYGIQISRFNREITSFVKNKLSTHGQLTKYLSNRGYVKVYP